MTESTRPAGSPLAALDTERLRSRVDSALGAFLDRQEAVLAGVDRDCLPVLAAVRSLMAGGKRLRPAFCYWGWRGAGGPADDAIAVAAAALELFQAAALIHDDVMDDSDTRRGMPAVHRRFAGLHRELEWHGDGERFGMSAGVLAGDLCLAWTDELFAGSGLDAGRLTAGRPIFNRMRTELLGGQYLDVLGQVAPSADPVRAVAHARHVIRYKSAKYTIEHPLLIGGTLAGAEPGLLATYSAYGLPLGEAFQLRDDVLGVFGDPDETGKPAGDDLREGKRTVLIGLALQHANAAQAALVRRLLGDPRLDAEGVAAMRGVLSDTGARDIVERMIIELAAEAGDALAAGQVEEPARTVLEELISATTARST